MNAITPSWQGPTTNYLVPAGGTTHGVSYTETFSAAPVVIDWRNFTINNFPFQPQGAFIDNTLGVGTLTVTVLPINYSITVGAGQSAEVQFPAPNGMTMQITGNGQATLFFVDFPVLPTGVSSGSGTQNVAITNQPTVTIGGQPIQVTSGSNAAQFINANISNASEVSVNLPSNSSFTLKKISISVSDAVAAATAQDVYLQLLYNGAVVFSRAISLPAAGGSAFGGLQIEEDFGGLGIALNTNPGTSKFRLENLAGNAEVNITAGTISTNLYYA